MTYKNLVKALGTMWSFNASHIIRSKNNKKRIKIFVFDWKLSFWLWYYKWKFRSSTIWWKQSNILGQQLLHIHVGAAYIINVGGSSTHKEEKNQVLLNCQPKRREIENKINLE